MKPVRLSPKAADDLEAIGDFIARDSPTRALSFVDELLGAWEAIGHTPKAYPERPELASGVRRAVHPPYLIFYTIGRDEIRIERVLHGARDLRGQEIKS